MGKSKGKNHKKKRNPSYEKGDLQNTNTTSSNEDCQIQNIEKDLREGKKSLKDRCKSSLFLQALRVGIVLAALLAILLGLIFYLLPLVFSQETSFAADIETSKLQSIAGLIRNTDINTDTLAFSADGIVGICADSININGEEYVCKEDEEPYIVISPNANSSGNNITLISSNHDIHFKSGLGKKDNSITEVSYSGLIQLDNLKNRLDLFTDGSVTVSAKKNCSLVVQNSLLTFYGIVSAENETIDNSENDWELIDNIVCISFPKGIKKMTWNSGDSKKYTLTNTYINAINMTNIEEMAISEGYGNISVSYVPIAEEHPLKRQELKIQSEGRTISATIASQENDTYFINISGYADSIELAKNSMKPSLLNWYKENVYLTPTILVTIIGGAITLVKLNNDKEEKKKEKSS